MPTTAINFEQSSDLNRFATARGDYELITATNTDGQALRVNFTPGTTRGASLRLLFNDVWGYEPEEAWCEFDLYIPRSVHDADIGGKMPGWDGIYQSGSTAAGRGGAPATGSDGWSARGLFGQTNSNSVRFGYYGYHVDMPGQYGEYLWWNERIPKDQFVTVRQHVKLNTPGRNDGVLTGWIDGRKAYERTNMRFRDTSSLKIRGYWINPWWAPEGPNRNTFMAFDNFTFSDSPPGGPVSLGDVINDNGENEITIRPR